jgi:hypothetical protein
LGSVVLRVHFVNDLHECSLLVKNKCLAQSANAPVVVLATTGTEKISKNVPFRATKVKMQVLEVLDAKRVQSMTTDDLCTYTHDLIERHVG